MDLGALGAAPYMDLGLRLENQTLIPIMVLVVSGKCRPMVLIPPFHLVSWFLPNTRRLPQTGGIRMVRNQLDLVIPEVLEVMDRLLILALTALLTITALVVLQEVQMPQEVQVPQEVQMAQEDQVPQEVMVLQEDQMAQEVMVLQEDQVLQKAQEDMVLQVPQEDQVPQEVMVLQMAVALL